VRSRTFHSREKEVRLSCGSSPHNRRPSGVEKPCSTAGHNPATKPRRRRLFPGISLPGTMRQRFSARAQCHHCPLRSHGSCMRWHRAKLLLLCKLPKASSYHRRGPGDFVFLLRNPPILQDNRLKNGRDFSFASPTPLRRCMV